MEVIFASALNLGSATVDELKFRLFPGVYHPFVAEVFSKCLKRDSLLHINQAIGIADFRDLQANIVRKHKDPEGLEIKKSNRAADVQQGHTTRTALDSYTLTDDQPHGVDPDITPALRRASRWWQHLAGTQDLIFICGDVLTFFVEIQELESPPDNGPKGCTGSHTDSGALSELKSQIERIENKLDAMNANFGPIVNEAFGCALAVQDRKNSSANPSPRANREVYVPHPSLIRMLRDFLGNGSATFKTPEQAEALEFTLFQKRHLLLVGPTAMGKTLTYMLPAVQRDYGVTCVLLPLSALHTDFERRCRELGIESSEWTPRNHSPKSKIVYVSPEHAQMDEFGGYLTDLAAIGLLKQIVIDEVHLVKAHSTFRFCFAALESLLSSGESQGRSRGTVPNFCIGVPFLLMTATCPPKLRSEILSSLGIRDCHVIHAPTNRPEISYRVDLSKTVGDAKERLVAEVKNQLTKVLPDSYRGLVYCRSKKDVEELAEVIGCDAFHAGRPLEERKASFEAWVRGKNRFMVCSSLMGCGIDVEGVTVVYHFRTPWSILDFAQESGRAGRGGNPSVSVVYAATDEREHLPDDSDGGVDLYGKETMREWVLQSSECRRITLGSFLDDSPVTCLLLKNAVLCDVCTKESLKPHLGKPTTLSAQTIPTSDTPALPKLPTVPPMSLEYASTRHRRAEDAQ